MLINKRNYDSMTQLLLEEEKRLCEKVVEIFGDCNMKNINIACVGNSISSGYSKCDEMLPFFARSALYKMDYSINFYSYARVRRNEELNVLKWYHRNISHQEINKLLLADIMAKKNSYAEFNKSQYEEYKKIVESSKLGFRDYTKLENNIMIYNGLSGSFTDIIRKGEAFDKQMLLKCFKTDYEYLKIFLLEVYLDNPNIQIYVCGLPDILGVGITSIFDSYMKKAVSMIPNAVYIKGATRNVFHYLKNQKEPDYHYSRPEYLYLLCSIWKSIEKNLIPIRYKSEMLYELDMYSTSVEFKDTTSKGDVGELNKRITECTKKYSELFAKYSLDINRSKKDIWNYYNKNYLVHFGCTDRSAVKCALLNNIL